MINSILHELINGLIVSFLLWIIGRFTKKIFDFLTIHNQGFDLTGCWWAEHGSYISGDINAIEIIYIWQHGENIRYKMEQYANFEDTRRRFYGNGVIKAGVISSYYYPLDKQSKLVGCMNLQVKTKRASEIYLSGTFYEIDERKKEHDFQNYPDDYYKIYRMNLDLVRKLKLKYYRYVFISYRECAKYIEQFKE